jgi:hypothetical protein
MEIARDVFVTDARQPLVTVAVASRDLDAHRLLSGLSEQDKAELGRLLREHAAAVQALLRKAWAARKPEGDTSSFGCGT